MAGGFAVLRRMVVGLVVAMVLAGSVQAGDARITVSGEGRAVAPPDIATLAIGVSAQAGAAQEAMAEVSAAMQGVLARLSEVGLEARDLQTGALSLAPRRASETGEVIGFAARNSLDVTVRELDALGAVLDAALAQGANELHGLSFAARDPAPLHAQARRAAVADAMDRAALYADAAGVALGPLVTLRDEGLDDGVRPMMRLEAAGMADALAEGEIAVTARVVMSFAIE